jgi:hypothetical protein
MNLEDREQSKLILEQFAELNSLLAKTSYSPADKARMVVLMVALGLKNADQGPFVILRRNRGRLLTRPTAGGIVITADGRADWVGGLELREETIRHTAVLNTARVIANVGADILGVVEAENRPALVEFNRVMIPEVGGTAYRHVMVIDGNDDRGIDLGLMCKDDFEIAQMRSHVDDRMANGKTVFSRDCPEYDVVTPHGKHLTIMMNHFKSKGFGTQASSSARRKAQATRAAEIYEALKQAGNQHVAVIGDFNDTPASVPLHRLYPALARFVRSGRGRRGESQGHVAGRQAEEMGGLSGSGPARGRGVGPRSALRRPQYLIGPARTPAGLCATR